MAMYAVIRDMNIKTDFVAVSEIQRLMMQQTDDPNGRKRLFFFLRYINDPASKEIEGIIKKEKIFSFNTKKKRKEPLEIAIYQYYRLYRHGEYSMRAVNKIIKKFNEEPTDWDNFIALAIIGQMIDKIPKVDKDAFEKALDEFGDIARYVFYGDKMLSEETLRMNPELWIVKKPVKIEFKRKRRSV